MRFRFAQIWRRKLTNWRKRYETCARFRRRGQRRRTRANLRRGRQRCRARANLRRWAGRQRSGARADCYHAQWRQSRLICCKPSNTSPNRNAGQNYQQCNQNCQVEILHDFPPRLEILIWGKAYSITDCKSMLSYTLIPPLEFRPKWPECQAMAVSTCNRTSTLTRATVIFFWYYSNSTVVLCRLCQTPPITAFDHPFENCTSTFTCYCNLLPVLWQ